MVIAWLLFTALGCGETSPETLVDELRAVVSVANPPEVQPREIFEYTTYVYNPDEKPLELLTWVCTNLGEGCLEAAGGSESVVRSNLEGVAPTATRSLSTSPSLFGILPETGPLTATQVWTLICEEGACPQLDGVQTMGENDTWSQDTQDLLGDPLSWMAELPTSGVSLAYQLLTTSLSEEPHQNPRMQASPNNPTALKKGEAFSLEFRVSGTFAEDARLYNYISAGGFEMTDTFVNVDDCTIINGIAPEDVDEAIVWIVLLDGLGGADVWTTTLEVR